MEAAYIMSIYQGGCFVWSLTTSINRTLAKALIWLAATELGFREITIGLPLHRANYRNHEQPARIGANYSERRNYWGRKCREGTDEGGPCRRAFALPQRNDPRKKPPRQRQQREVWRSDLTAKPSRPPSS